jgi:hypothetical protein
MLVLDKKTGEVIITPYSKFMHPTQGLDVGTMVIQHKDFAWNDKIRDFEIVDGEKEDRQAYIDSFESEAGVYNILKKYSLTGDASLLNAKQGVYLDLSNLPTDELNPAKLSDEALAALSKLNEVLGTSLTAEELQNMSAEEISALIKGKVEEKKDPEPVKETKKEGEE